jgi:hypothetical protein
MNFACNVSIQYFTTTGIVISSRSVISSISSSKCFCLIDLRRFNFHFIEDKCLAYQSMRVCFTLIYFITSRFLLIYNNYIVIICLSD